MAEIKSTLDLIMEKTKDLTMTEEEKRELREKDLAGKVRGLVQKVLDGAIDMDRFRYEAGSLAGEDAEAFLRALRKDLISRLEPGGDNGPVLTILEQAAQTDATGIRKRLERFASRLEKEREAHEKGLRKRLKKRGLSGSALIPNLEADEKWIEYRREVIHECRKGLEKAMSL